MIEFNLFDFAGIDFPFSIHKGKHWDTCVPHTHDFIELEVITSGSATHIVDGKSHQISRGDVVVLKPSHVHELQNVHELEHYNMKFDLEKLILIDKDIEKLSGFQSLFILEPFQNYAHDYASHMTLDEEQLIKVEMMCDLMCKELDARNNGYKWVIKSYFIVLITYLARNFSPNTNNVSPKVHDIIETVSFIQENLSQRITVPMLSKMACLSTRQYTRIFKEVYGVTPMEYVINCRLSMACRMMKNSHKSLLEISACCGFGDNVSFTRLFKDRYHVTPGEYRKGME